MSHRELASEVVDRLRTAGYEAFWAGGCVRDLLLGVEPSNYSIATNASSEVIRRSIHGMPPATVGLRASDSDVLNLPAPAILIAPFADNHGHRADYTHPGDRTYSARHDAFCRDFTVNGMLYDPVEQQVIDYVGGQEDLRAGILRTIGEPGNRFSEDPIRMLRAIRVAACIKLKIEPQTMASLRRLASVVRDAPVCRVQTELGRMLVHSSRVHALELMLESTLLEAVLPELLEMKGLPQGRPCAPTGDLWDHILRVMDLIGSAPSFSLAFAALTHDVGKRRTLGRTPDRYTFYSHEEVSRRMAGEMCKRLQFSTTERERIEWLVKKHQYLCDARHMRESKLHPVLSHEAIHDLLILHEADAIACGNSTDHVAYCKQLLQRPGSGAVSASEAIE